MGFARIGTGIGLPTESSRKWALKREKKGPIAQSYRLQNSDKLTDHGDGNPVGHECQALTNKETRGKTHDLFEQVL